LSKFSRERSAKSLEIKAPDIELRGEYIGTHTS